MGSGPSYELANIEFVPLVKPVAAINLRFCHDELLTLEHKSSSFQNKCIFRNVHTDVVRFTVKQTGMSGRETLFDVSDVAIVNYRRKMLSSDPIYYTHLGSEHDGDAALKIHAQYHSGLKTEVRIVFTDLLTHEECELSFEGHWRKRTACFWLDRGHRGVREPVAKVFCPDGVSTSKYHIAIVPHMDTALITMVCAMLGRQQSDQETVVVVPVV